MNLFVVIIVLREFLFIDFVFRILVFSGNLFLVKCKVVNVICMVLLFFFICEGCFDVIYKFVKDWLIDRVCYGEYEFIVDEKKGYYIFVDFCIVEFDCLKW